MSENTLKDGVVMLVELGYSFNEKLIFFQEDFLFFQEAMGIIWNMGEVNSLMGSKCIILKI